MLRLPGIKSGFLWLVFLVVLDLATGCSGSRSTVSSYTGNLPNTVLWKISSDDMEAPSYLLGTIHLIPGDLYFWPDQFQQAYEAVDQVVLETNELGLDPASMMSFMPKIMMPEGQSLDNLVTESEYSQIEDYFDEMGMPLMFIKNIKPFFLYMLLEIDISTFLQDDIKSYELQITEKANQDQKPIFGLETLEFQISIFDSIPYQDQADLLVKAIEKKSEIKEGTEVVDNSDHLYQTYVNQDLNAMLQEVKETEVGLMNFSKLLLEDRNLAWIPKIEAFIHQKPSLIAVGAAHLPGEMGVIHQLRKAGYTLTPIMNSSNGSH